MAEKVTTMVLKVDLQCNRCTKKVKKVLCEICKIRDQMYNKEANTVTITVVCCSPEKIRDKIRRKGGKSIKSIEIKPPPKPEEPKKKPEKSKPDEPEKTKPEKKPQQKPEAHALPPPIVFCCTDCYHWHVAGPCYFGRPPPRPCFCLPVYDRCGCGCGGYQYCYASGENPQVCSIM